MSGRSWIRRLVLCCCAALAAQRSDAGVHVVTVQSFAFIPETVIVQPGDVVQWVWVNGSHTVTSGVPCVPDGLQFDAPMNFLNPTFSWTVPPSATSVPYFCRPHCFGGMSGMIIVEGEPTGACCLPNGTCLEAATAMVCIDSGGAWQGPGTPCADVICQVPGIGACCLGGLCLELTPLDCANQLGYYNGDGSSCAGGLGAMPIDPTSDGIRMHRLNLTFPLAPQPDSAYGLLYADASALASHAGFSGYLNMYTERGWVVRNLPVDPNALPTGISVLFDAGPYDGSPVINATIALSPAPQVCFFDPGSEPFIWWPPLSWNAEGSDVPRTFLPFGSVDLSAVIFLPLGETGGTQLGPDSPPNIEQDSEQCMPAAVANSLQWMENEYGIGVPHPHQPGIRDGSLVGELDKKMQRPAHQPVASAINMVNGKLDYINENGLADEVHVKHKQRPPINWISGDKTRGDATSHENTDPNASLLDWIRGEIEAGEDVELRIGWDGGGGHMVRVTGCGTILGVPYITWVHDANQGTDPNAPGGVAQNGGVSANDGGHGFSWVTADNKVTCTINGFTGSATIDFAVSESPVYPPTTPTAAGAQSQGTPRHQARASQYTATRYRAAGGFKEDGIYKDIYDDPAWENANKTLKIDNVAVATNVKEVHLNIIFAAAQVAAPNIGISTSSGQAPIKTETQWRDGMTNLLIIWYLPDQPAWEKINFPDASFFNFTGIKRMGVATYCQRRPDANNNGIDDRLEIIQDPSQDQNSNGIPDGVDFGDCNGNGAPDIVDIAIGESSDCDENGRPDSCDLLFDPGIDCNENAEIDACETVINPAIDLNGNRIPDPCEVPVVCLGDADCDGDVDFFDIDPFVARIGCPSIDPVGCNSGCAWQSSDVDQDGDVDFFDIDPFVARIGSLCP